MFRQVETETLAVGYYNFTMKQKRGKYKQKQKNVERLKVFLKKVENGKFDKLGNNKL